MWLETSPSYQSQCQYCGCKSRQPKSTEFIHQHFCQIFYSVVVNAYGLYIVCSILMVLFSIDSQELFKVVATDFIAGIAMTHHVLVPSQRSLCVLHSSTLCWNSRYHIIFCCHGGLIVRLLT